MKDATVLSAIRSALRMALDPNDEASEEELAVLVAEIDRLLQLLEGAEALIDGACEKIAVIYQALADDDCYNLLPRIDLRAERVWLRSVRERGSSDPG